MLSFRDALCLLSWMFNLSNIPTRTWNYGKCALSLRPRYIMAPFCMVESRLSGLYFPFPEPIDVESRPVDADTAQCLMNKSV